MDLIVGTNTQVTETLTSLEGNISRGLPKDIPFGRVLNFALTAVVNTPALRNCTQTSFIKALVECSMMGLEPNTPLEQAYLIPYGKTVKLMPSYKGLITLAHNTGLIDYLYCSSVFNCDIFRVSQGTSPSIEHTPDYEQEDRVTAERFHGAYAVCFLKGSNRAMFEYMTKKEIDLIRVKAKTSNIWKDYYFEMAKKTVMKRLLKIIPRSAESRYLSQAINLDNQLYEGKSQTFETNIEAPPLVEVPCPSCNQFHSPDADCPDEKE